MKRNYKSESKSLHRFGYFDHPLQGNTLAIYTPLFVSNNLFRFGYYSSTVKRQMFLLLIDGTFTNDKKRKISITDERLMVTSPSFEIERDIIRRIQMEAER